MEATQPKHANEDTPSSCEFHDNDECNENLCYDINTDDCEIESLDDHIFGNGVGEDYHVYKYYKMVVTKLR